MRLTADHTLRERNTTVCHNRIRRTEKVDERGHIIRAHIEHGAAAVLVEEFRVRMPAFGTSAEEEHVRADDLADRTFIDETACRLDACTHERIRRTAEVQILFLRESHQFARLFEVGRERFFGIYVLSGKKRRLGHTVMVVRTGDVQDDIHFRVSEELVHILVDLRYAVCSRLLFRFFAHQIADTRYFQIAERLRDIRQINTADVSASNKSDFHKLPPVTCL